jgi:hypothetical protein
MMIAEILDDLRFFPVEIAWLEDEIKKLQNENNPIWAETIRIEQERLKKCKKALQRGIAIINGVEDPLLQEVLILRYVKGLNWSQIAREIPGNMQPNSYNKLVMRWLEKEEVKCEN